MKRSSINSEQRTWHSIWQKHWFEWWKIYVLTPCFQVQVNQFGVLKLFCCKIGISLEWAILWIALHFMCQGFGVIFLFFKSRLRNFNRPYREIYLCALKLRGHSVLLLKPWLKCLNVHCKPIGLHLGRNWISTEDEYTESVPDAGIFEGFLAWNGLRSCRRGSTGSIRRWK